MTNGRSSRALRLDEAWVAELVQRELAQRLTTAGSKVQEPCGIRTPAAARTEELKSERDKFKHRTQSCQGEGAD
jgi:hypothetical protein